jgi:Protein of unknown function, DUF480
MDFNELLLELSLKSDELLFQFGDFGAECRDLVFEVREALVVGGAAQCARRGGRMRHEIALLWVLLLRGPQTPGELRTRTERLTGSRFDFWLQALRRALRESG